MSEHYILDGHDVKVVDLMEWAAWFQTAERRVAIDDLPDGKMVSTVFLGIDHNFGGEGPPLLFETMVFGADGNEIETERYSTWDEAEAGHKEIVSRYQPSAA